MSSNNNYEEIESVRRTEMESIFNPLFEGLYAKDPDLNYIFGEMKKYVLHYYANFMRKYFPLYDEEMLVDDCMSMLFEEYLATKNKKNRDRLYFKQQIFCILLRRVVYKDIAFKSETTGNVYFDCLRIRHACENYGVNIDNDNCVIISRLTQIPITRIVDCIPFIQYLNQKQYAKANNEDYADDRYDEDEMDFYLSKNEDMIV